MTPELEPMPAAIRDYCLECSCRDRSPAYLSADCRGRLLRWGGALDHYRLGNLRRGDQVEEKAIYLKGYLPLNHSPVILPQLEISPDVYAELHLFRNAGKQWVLMLDATRCAMQKRRKQQTLNQQQLRAESMQSKLQLVLELLKKLGLVVFLRGADTFQPLGDIPGWLRAHLPPGSQAFELGKAFHFLENFLVDARAFWDRREPGVLKAGFWRETAASDNGPWLDAFAVCLPGRDALVIAELEGCYQEMRELLQKARQRVLDHEALVREIQHRDILLHCLIHDLASPVSSIHIAISLLHGEDLSDDDRRLLKACESSAEHIQSLVKQVRDICSPRAGQGEQLEPRATVDLAAVIRDVAELMEPSAIAAGVTLERDPSSPWQEPCLARGERLLLERVLFNLLDNALRFSPREGKIRLRLCRTDSWWKVEVEDQGPGVDPDFEKSLFVRFAQGPTRPGKAGLGLYFCQLVIASWGGRIEYRPGHQRGSCFRFRLPERVPR